MTLLATSVAPAHSSTLTTEPIAPARASALTVLVDLAATGAPVTGGVDTFDPTTIKADLTHLGRLAQAARAAGANGALVGSNFRLASDRKRALDAWLDPAVAARRLRSALGGTVVPALDVHKDGLGAAASLARVARTEGWYALDVAAAGDPFGIEDVDALHTALLQTVARELGVGQVPQNERPRLVAHARTTEDAAAAGRFADVVRLHLADQDTAAELAAAVREAATEAGREQGEVSVLVDVRVVVSADAAAARERIFLLDALAPVGQERPLDALGNPEEITAVLRSWAQAGIADGFVLIPGSLKADAGPLLTGVLPAVTGVRAGQ